MSQMMKGLILGSPGPVGSKGICILYGLGSPSASSDPFVSGAAPGSLFIDYTASAPALWFRGASSWVQITIP
jgi:hypothetical protein